MGNLFDRIPKGFFNYLASGAQNRIYSSCLLVIYKEYERQISFRLPRARLRDALAIFLMENHIEMREEDMPDPKNFSDVASAILRRFCDESVGWLEEETDDATYEKQIMLTERGVMLAEFLQSLMTPEKEEYASFLIVIHDLFRNADVWREHPYVNGLKAVYRQARLLSGSLKKLATYIRKIIERMVREQTLESLTENIIEYLEGSFIREYARLTSETNIHMYRGNIREALMRLRDDAALFDRIVRECMMEESLSRREAEDKVLDMIQMTGRFLYDDYDRIMQDIKGKINLYLQIAVGRARFLRHREPDLRGHVEETIRYLARGMTEMELRDTLPEDMQELFPLRTMRYLDENSLRYPRVSRSVRGVTESEYVEISEEEMEKQKREQIREADNPYSRDRARAWLSHAMRSRRTIASDDLPLSSRNDLLMALSAVAYSEENGYEVEKQDGYFETESLLLHRFVITRKDGETHE